MVVFDPDMLMVAEILVVCILRVQRIPGASTRHRGFLFTTPSDRLGLTHAATATAITTAPVAVTTSVASPATIATCTLTMGALTMGVVCVVC